MAKVTTSYIEGIDQDTSVNKRNPNTYYSAYNVRVLLNESLSSGAITNIKGTLDLNLSTALENAAAAKGLSTKGITYSIIGAGDIRDTLVLFVVGTTALGVSSSYIFGIELDGTGITSSTLYYTDAFTTDGSKLNFSTAYPIRGFASVYESPQIIKIYWTDNKALTTDFHPLRVMNIAQTNLMNGSVGISAYSFNIIPEFIPTAPSITSIASGGNIKNGLVQYAYQLYNKYGTKSLLSPLSNLVHITPSSDNAANSAAYIGGLEGEDSGKIVNISISVSDTSYNRIKVFAIHYSSELTSPTVNVLADRDAASTIALKDDGINYVSTYTLEELVSLADNFTAKDLAVKDNILFATNIKSYNFDFNYDARAYRFPLYGYTTKIYHGNGTFDSVGATADPSAEHHYNWGVVTSIPESHDAINADNSYTTSIPSVADEFAYKRGSNRFGGSGGNISYEFELSSKNINEATGAQQIYTINSTGHYKGYEDYAQVSLRDWQRDEVYRFGIVGFNSKMQPSPVKWIGDIRMPAYNQDDIYSTNNTSTCIDNGYGAISNTTANPTTQGILKHNRLNVKFTVANLPTEVKYYQIVYVKREEYDRTVIAEGLIGHVVLDDDFYKIPAIGFRGSSMTGYYSTQVNNVFQFVSPDILFREDLDFNDGDYLRIDTKVLAPSNAYVEFDTNYGGGSYASDTDLVVYNAYAHYNSLANSVFQPIKNLYYLNPIPNITNGYTSINVEENYKMLNWIQYRDVGSSREHYGIGGSKALLTFENAIDRTQLITESTYYVQYKRPRANQYGGNTYESRKRNIYIPCSDIIARSNTTARAYGDIYVSVLDYVYGIFYADGSVGERLFSVANFPVASRYNCNVRTSKSPSRLLDNANYVLLQEEVGTYTATIGGTVYTYTQNERLYAYNSAYNRLSDIVTYFPKPDDFEVVSTEDVLTKYSDTKIPKDYIDAWINFRTLNSNIVDSRFGAINKLEIFNNQLVFMQDKAIGIWYVNARELTNTNNPGALSIGTGGIMEQYIYITKESGTKQQFSVVNTNSAIYYFDSYNKQIHRLAGSEQLQITKVLGLNKLLSDLNYSSTDNPIIDANTGIIAAYNKKHNEVLFTVRGAANGAYISHTIVYSELGNKFYSFLDIAPKLYKQFNNLLLSTNLLSKLYLHDFGDYGSFYASLCDSRITLLVNPRVQEGLKQYVFSEHNFFSDCSLNGVEVDKTISTVQCSNTYQSSNIEDFDANPELLLRRNRLYRFYVPRENNSEESRLADTHLKTTLTFRNGSNYKFTLYDVDTIFLPTSL